MKWLLFTDLHLEKRKTFGYDEKLGIEENVKESIKLLTLIRQRVEKGDIEKVIFLGDLFERRSDIKTDLFVIAYKLFKNIADKTELIMVAGNHDIKGNFVTFQTFEFAKVIKSPIVEGEGFRVAYVPYITKAKQLRDLEEADVCIGHFSVKGMPKSKIGDSNITFEDVSKFKRVILGHEHKHSSSKNITYLGASIPTTFKDDDVEPCYWLFENLNLTKVPVKLPKFLILQYPVDNTLIKDNYVRIEVSDLKYSLSSIKEEAKQAGAKYVEVVFKSEEGLSVTPEDRKLLSFNLEDACKEYVKRVVKEKTEIPLLIKVGKEVLIDAVKKDRL